MYAQLSRPPLSVPSAVRASAELQRAALVRALPAAPPAPAGDAATRLSREDDALAALLARAVALRARPGQPAAPSSRVDLAAPVVSPAPSAHAVVARMPVGAASRLPGPLLMRNGDGDGQQPEGWGAWALRQAKNPWVWAGIGLGCTVAGLVYLNSDKISEAVTKEAIKHPSLLSSGAKLMGKDYVADKVGTYLVKSLGEMAKESSIANLTPSGHLTDVVDSLARTIPGGGLANMGLKMAQKVSENQELVSTGLQVAKELGPEFVLDVVKKVAVDHGGDMALHGVEIATKPLYESAFWAYSKVGSNYW